MHFVRNAVYSSEFKLVVTFEDERSRLVDLEPYLDGEVFEPLKNIEYFKNFRVNTDLDTVVWENGADFSPDFLYEIGKLVAESTHAV